MLTTRRAVVVIVGVLFALAWAMPSLGASAGKVARTALGRANEAFHNANLAISSSNTAKTTANQANATASSANSNANSAKTAAAQAQSTANTANTTANQALTKANSIVEGARAFARVRGSSCAAGNSCTVDHARAITAAHESATAGVYCVTAPTGLGQASVPWLTNVDTGDSTAGGTATAEPDTSNTVCSSTEYEVRTTRLSSPSSGTLVSNLTTDVSFFIVVP